MDGGVAVYLVFPRVGIRVHLLAIPTVAMLFLLEGTVPACLLLLAAILHECGHLAALRAFGVRVRRIDFMPMGAVIAYDDSLCSHRQTSWIAFAGAGANLFAAAVCFLFAGDLFVLYFITANIALAIMNLLPIETLDGGTLLRSVLLVNGEPLRTERICRTVSRVCLALLAACLLAVGMHSAFPLWYLLLSAAMLVQIFR